MDLANDVLKALRQITRAIDLHSQNLIKKYGLTGPQLLAMKEIAQKEEISPGELAKILSISQATITAMLDRLEKKEYVRRNRGGKDRRKVQLVLLEKGKEIISLNPSLLQEDFVENFQELKPWEQTLILSSLQRVSELMNANTLAAPPILSTSPEEKGEGFL